MLPAPGPQTPFALVCQGLRKQFAGVEVVCNLDLSVASGTIVALLGPSGCGKTTTLRMIAGLERIDEGRIEVAGRVAAQEGRHVPPDRRRVGMVFQDHALFPHLSVARNVGFGLSRNGDSQHRIDEMLELVGLPGYGRRMPWELSGGQQQRVALARALAPKPALLLMDEPFSNLDPELRVSVRRDVSDILRQAGATAVLVTHDQEEALSLADRVALMVRGRIAQIDDPETLYRRPVSRNVASFIGASSFLAGSATGYWAVTELGRVRLLGPQHGAVDIVVRPEEVILAAAQPGEGDGVVARREYFGGRQSLSIRLTSGAEVKAATGPAVDLEVGAEVSVTMPTPTVAFPTLADS